MARRRGVRTQLRPGGIRRAEVPPRFDRAPDRSPGLMSQLQTARVAAAALLPIRFFFGATFLIAGLDKLLSPSFLRTGDPASIGTQLELYARSSPVGGLVTAVLPIAPQIGFLIAVAEIAVGIGALTGLAFRLAAAGGAALSLLFWLTVSWSTRPFYYGPDLPYLMGWVVLAIAGHGNLLVPSAIMVPTATSVRHPAQGVAGIGAGAGGWDGRDMRRWETPVSPARRAFIQAGMLGALAVILAAAATPFRGLFASTRGVGLTGDRLAPSPGATTVPGSTPGPSPAGSSPQASPGATNAPGASPGATNAPGASPGATNAPIASPGTPGLAIGQVADVKSVGYAAFQVPVDAPAPLPAGDPAVVLKLKDGTFVAYDLICTHQGCQIDRWDSVNQLLVCPCHGAEFDAASNGAVVAGPARTRLPSLPLAIDSATGTIYLKT
jgi:thiosulfate dehydrogenase [quinone] large subunit